MQLASRVFAQSDVCAHAHDLRHACLDWGGVRPSALSYHSVRFVDEVMHKLPYEAPPFYSNFSYDPDRPGTSSSRPTEDRTCHFRRRHHARLSRHVREPGTGRHRRAALATIRQLRSPACTATRRYKNHGRGAQRPGDPSLDPHHLATPRHGQQATVTTARTTRRRCGGPCGARAAGRVGAGTYHYMLPCQETGRRGHGIWRSVLCLLYTSPSPRDS